MGNNRNKRRKLKFEFVAVNVPVPSPASPDIDWYIIIPAWSVSPLFPVPLAVSVEFVTVAVFFPSITTICDPFAVPSVFSMLMFPVEYIIGDPLPFVSSFEFLTVTVPSPLSVASVAQLPPCVVISTFSASIYPPYVASSHPKLNSNNKKRNNRNKCKRK